MTVIRLEQVTKLYRRHGAPVRALDQVSLTVADGEFVAVRGPSGSGKSTLLLTIAAMVRPSEGRVVVRGDDLYALSGAQRARFRARNVGFVFQLFHLVPYLSVLDNVLLPTALLPQAGDRELARELLTRFGMAGRLDHTPAELSTGERQRTAIARALINRPWLVLADEPTGNLDPETGAEIMQYLSEFHREGGTVIVVTHEPWVEQTAQRTIHLRGGRTAAPPPVPAGNLASEP